MKLRSLVAGLILMGSLTMVGCDDVQDTGSAMEENNTKVEEELEETDESEDYVQGWNDCIDDSEVESVNMQSLATTTLSAYNNGQIKDMHDYLRGYLACLYEDGSITSGANQVELTLIQVLEQVEFTIGSLPENRDNDLETKKKCALGAIKNSISWDYEVDKDSLQFQEQGEVDGQIIYAVMQGNATVGRASYEPSTGNVGYEVNAPVQ